MSTIKKILWPMTISRGREAQGLVEIDLEALEDLAGSVLRAKGSAKVYADGGITFSVSVGKQLELFDESADGTVEVTEHPDPIRECLYCQVARPEPAMLVLDDQGFACLDTLACYETMQRVGTLPVACAECGMPLTEKERKATSDGRTICKARVDCAMRAASKRMGE